MSVREQDAAAKEEELAQREKDLEDAHLAVQGRETKVANDATTSKTNKAKFEQEAEDLVAEYPKREDKSL